MTSKGAELLGKLLKELFPGYTIKTEVPIKIGRKTLFVDFVIPSLKIAVEYHGRQHYEHVTFFHGSATNSGFKESKERDAAKAKALSETGFTLIEIGYKDTLNAENLRQRIYSSLNS